MPPPQKPREKKRSAGPVDVSSLTRKAKDDLGMMEQPKEPKFKLAMLEVTITIEGSSAFGRPMKIMRNGKISV